MNTWVQAAPTLLVHIAMVGWFPFVLVLFGTLTPRRAFLAAFLLGWLFLPNYRYTFESLPEVDKGFATSMAVLAGMTIFDAEWWSRLRLCWMDVVLAVWCVSGGIPYLIDGLGAYPALSVLFRKAVIWGIPYIAARVYLTDWEGARELATAVVIGGLIYLPLCLFEMWMAPRLHHGIYGFRTHSFTQAWRFGGWRPEVFLGHGLATSMFVATSAVGAWVLHRSGAVTRWFDRATTGYCAAGLGMLAVFCRSTGAVLLLAAVSAALLCVESTKSKAALWLLCLTVPLYVGTRATGLWDGETLLSVTESLSSERSTSLAGRLNAENLLAAKAATRPFFGWGFDNRYNIADESGQRFFGTRRTRDKTVATDGGWLISFGTGGGIGLTAFFLLLMLPAVRFLARWPIKMWRHPTVAPGVALALMSIMHALDMIPNNFPNPLYILALGCLTGLPSPAEVLAKSRNARVRSSPGPIGTRAGQWQVS